MDGRRLNQWEARWFWVAGAGRVKSSTRALILCKTFRSAEIKLEGSSLEKKMSPESEESLPMLGDDEDVLDNAELDSCCPGVASTCRAGCFRLLR
jgi:hypothetical protein